ncbi:MAG: hypothetical protein ACK5MT_10650 [Actinomycetales bacterium]
MPEASGQGPRHRLEQVWAGLKARGIGYAHERLGSSAAGQVIRPPGEVLATARNGTCLDLALVLAGACELAGLPWTVILLDSAQHGAPGHALVGVLLGRDGWPDGWGDPVLDALPETWADDVRPGGGGSQPVLVVDPNGLATRAPRPEPGVDTDLATAAAHGYEYLRQTDERWTWRASVTASLAQPFTPPGVPANLPLREIFLPHESAPSPLKQLRAEYRLTPFQLRDEYDLLVDFCEEVRAGSATGIAIIHGVGGCGKTRLALEVAEHLRLEGWYAGPLRETTPEPAGTPEQSAGDGSDDDQPTPAIEVQYLGSVGAPLCVVVDYADGRLRETIALLHSLKRRLCSPGFSPAVVILTARSMEGAWWSEVDDALESDTHPHRPELTQGLAATHKPLDVFQQTLVALGADRSDRVPAAPSVGRTWTTLDLVMEASLAAEPGGEGQLPTDRSDLYNTLLQHEYKYWRKTYWELTGHRPEKGILEKGAMCLTLLSPTRDNTIEALRQVPPLERADQWRYHVGEALEMCLGSGAGERLALRPDPIGDHFLLTQLKADLEGAATSRTLTHTLADADEETLLRCVLTLNRAGQDDPALAARLIGQLVRDGMLPGFAGESSDGRDETEGTTGTVSKQAEANQQRLTPRWAIAAAVAVAQRGPAEDALITLVGDAGLTHEQLPLDDLSTMVPDHATGPTELGRVVDEARLIRSKEADPEKRAWLWAQVSERRRAAGDRAGALTAIDEAVTLRRALAQANPAAFTPNLARSLQVRATLQGGAEAVCRWRDSLDALPSLTRAFLLARLCQWTAASDVEADREGLLSEAAQAVAGSSDAPRHFVVDTRMLVRGAATGLPGERLPAWVSASIPDAHYEAIVSLMSTISDPEALADLLTQHEQTLADPVFPSTADIVEFLHGGETDRELDPVRALIREVAEDGLAAVVARLRALGAGQRLINDWIATQTWHESLTFLQGHEDLRSKEVREDLAATDHPVARQHLAILALADRFDLHGEAGFKELHAILADAEAASRAADQALRGGDLLWMRTILTANSAVFEQARGQLCGAVLMAAASQEGDSLELLRHILVTARAELGVDLDLEGDPTPEQRAARQRLATFTAARAVSLKAFLRTGPQPDLARHVGAMIEELESATNVDMRDPAPDHQPR